MCVLIGFVPYSCTMPVQFTAYRSTLNTFERERSTKKNYCIRRNADNAHTITVENCESFGDLHEIVHHKTGLLHKVYVR